MNKEEIYAILDEAYAAGEPFVALRPDRNNNTHLHRWKKGRKAKGFNISGSFWVFFGTNAVKWLAKMEKA